MSNVLSIAASFSVSSLLHVGLEFPEEVSAQEVYSPRRNWGIKVNTLRSNLAFKL